MKTKNIFMLIVLVFTLSFSAYAQVEDGATRSITAGTQFYNIGIVKNLTEYEIVIKNPWKYDLLVGEIFVPKGIGVTVLKRKIHPADSGIIVVTVNPQYMEEGQFKKQIVVTTYTRNEDGTRISFTKSYGIKGQLL